MTEKLPETNIQKSKSRIFEKMKSDVSRTSDERADESVETGYCSAQHSSDLHSGAEATSESAVWISKDHGYAVSQSQKTTSLTRTRNKSKNTKKQEEVSEKDRKQEKKISISPDKAYKTRFRKKSTSPKKTDYSAECSQKSLLRGSPPQYLASTEGDSKSPKTERAAAESKKTKSPKKWLVQRLRSRTRSARSEATTSSHQSTEKSTKVGDPKDSANLGKSTKDSSSPKQRLKLTKEKCIGRRRSKSTSLCVSLDASEAEPMLKDKGSKKKSKASVKTKSPAKKEYETPAADLQQTSIIKSLADNCERVSSGIQSITLSKKDDVFSLLCTDETMDSSSNSTTEYEARREKTKKDDIGAEGGPTLQTNWRPQFSHQEGGFQDVVWAVMSSSPENTGTEMSVITDCSVAQGGSESKKGASTSSDTLSSIAGLKEELAKRPLLQRQKRAKPNETSDSDEDKTFRAICGSPTKKAAPERKPEESSQK